MLCGAPSFLDARLIQCPLPDFDVNARLHAVVLLLTLRVVSQLDVLKYAPPCGFSRRVARDGKCRSRSGSLDYFVDETQRVRVLKQSADLASIKTIRHFRIDLEF